jgi:DNA-binding IclR family transcriptional regulator
MPRRPAVRSVADERAAKGGVAAVDRAICLLAAFSPTRPALSLGELANLTRLYKSTILRLLASLEHAQMILRQPDGRYALGPSVARLHAAFSQSFSYASIAMPILRNLVAVTRESAAYYVRQGSERLCLCRVDAPQAVRDHIRVGDLLPIDRGAAGRVILAYEGEGEMETGLLIRQDRFAILVGDREPDLAGIAAPVFGPTGSIVGALALSMPRERLEAAWAANVKEAAANLTERFGGHFPAAGSIPVLSSDRTSAIADEFGSAS